MKFISVPHGDLCGNGIDALSAEDSIAEGYAEDLENADPTPEGYLSKRPGYQGKFGELPLRVISVQYTSAPTNNLTFTLDGSVDISQIQSTTGSRPIVVQGRTSAANAFNVGDFPNSADSVHYYPSFNADTRYSFATGTDTQVIAGVKHQLGTASIWVGTTESVSPTVLDNRIFVPDSVSINQATDDITVVETNAGPAFTGFIYLLKKTPQTGETYVSPNTSCAASSTTTTTIVAATHQLSNPNIQVKCTINTGTAFQSIIPASVVIAPNLDVTIQIQNGTASPFNAVFTLSDAPIANVALGSIPGGATQSVQLGSFIAPLTTPFLFVSCYLEQSLGGPREEVIPDSIVVDAASRTALVTFTNEMPTSSNFFIYWQNASVATNQLTVSASPILLADVFTDNRPELTLWGLDQQIIYSSMAAARAGWVTHLDTYKALGEGFLVSGLGGNLFNGKPVTPSLAAAYLIPAGSSSFYPRLRARVSGSFKCGPCFIGLTDTPQRTRGNIQGQGLGTGWAQASSLQFDPITGYVQVTLPIPGLAIAGVLSTAITTTPGLEDKLTIRSSGYAKHDGTWPIKSASVVGTTLTLEVANPNVTSADWNDLDSGAQCGVFTDRVSLDQSSPFIPEDVLLSSVLAENQQVEAYVSSGSTLLMDSLDSLIAFPSGLRIAGQRTSSVLPLRTLTDAHLVNDIVTGDNLVLSGPTSSYIREFRVLSVNVQGDIALTIDGNATSAVATATMGGGADTSTLAIGDQLLLVQAGPFTGTRSVTAIPNATTFQFASTDPTTGQAGTLLGKTVSIDESVQWADDVDSLNTVSVPGRWLPFEAPPQSSNEAPTTYVRYLDQSPFDNQPLLRSTEVNDSLFLNNGVDRALKIDGASVYRPGLPRWQAQLFIVEATAPAGKIVLTPITAATTGWVGNAFTVAASAADSFPIGTRIRRAGDALTTYQVIATDAVNARIFVDQNIAGASGADTLSNTFTFSYYFRLNAVDLNNNVVASAVTGSFDWTVETAQDFAARLRLVGLPALDIYDYDRLEVQIYRTKSNGVAPFYLLSTLPMSFNANQGYIDYVDTASDEDLRDLDPVNTALKGQELGVGWSHPIRAKRVTSAANRQVLANLTSDPYIDLRLVDIGPPITTSALSGTRYLLRKDGTDALTTTDMVNRIAYEFVTTGDKAVTNITNPSAGVFQVTAAAHGLSVGNWVYLFRQAPPGTNQQTYFMGWWQVAVVVDANNFQVDWVDTPAAPVFADQIDRMVAADVPIDVPVFLGTDYNYGYKVGNRLLATDPYENIATRRWANAVNTTQRMVNRSLPGMSTFRPWIIADAGGEFAVGQMLLRQTMNQPSGVLPSLQMPSSITGYNIFVNSVLRDPAEQVGAVQQLHPSRILVSYPNFAEIFDSPLAAVDAQSDSAVDVNPADGQEITSAIPFFGASAFGAALKDAVVVVFKSNSIYLVNLAEKAAGRNPIQRIESQGLGCTAPNSVTPVRDGIMFANESGIYKLKTDMTVYYMGRHMQRQWREHVNLAGPQLELIVGHNWSFGSQYKLSLPYDGSTVPNRVFAYNSIREYSMQGITQSIQLYSTREGSWTRQSGFGAIGWCNLGADSFQAGMKGRIFILRRTGLPQDYRDDNRPIAMTAIMRAMDMGDEGIRKTIPYAVITYRNPPNLGLRASTIVSSAVDLSDNFQPADLTVLPNRVEDTGSGDVLGNKVIGLRYSFNQKRGVRFQLAIANAGMDEPIEVTKIRYNVAGLSVKGITEAAGGAKPS